MDLSNLPEELLEEVAEYLSAKDVISCSQVNTQWESTFDKNRVWRKFCTFHPKYFYKQKSKLKNLSEIEFEQGCEAKETFFKERYVKENMFHGNFHTDQIKCGNVYCDSVLDSVDEVGNHWLFISCMEGTFFEHEHMLQVWNLNEDPVMHTSIYTPLGTVKRMLCSDLKMNQKKLFFMYQDIIVVYEFAYPLYELRFLYKTVFEPLTIFPEYTILEMKITSVGNVVLGFLYTSFQVSRTAPPFVHVWNDEGSLIFKEYGLLFPQLLRNYTPSRTSFPVMNLKTSKEKVAVVFESFNSELNARFFTMRIFNVKLLHYSNFCVNKCKNLVSFDICEHVVSLCYTSGLNNSVTIMCYHTETGNVIFKSKFNFQGDCIYQGLVAGNGEGELVVLENKNLFVFDLSRKKETNSFRVSGKEKTVTILQKGLLLIETTHKGVVSQEVWDYMIGKKKYVCSLASAFGIEQTSYSYSFIKNYSAPPKLIAFKNPMVAYPHDNKNTNIFVISFW